MIWLHYGCMMQLNEESGMPTLTLKNLPDELHQRLKARAAVHRRSLNSEAIVCLEEALGRTRPTAEEILAIARRLRRGFRGYVTDRDIKAAKDWGRA